MNRIRPLFRTFFLTAVLLCSSVTLTSCSTINTFGNILTNQLMNVLKLPTKVLNRLPI